MLSRAKYQIKKARWKKTASKGVFSFLYEQHFPNVHQRIDDIEFLAVDCEMTGLSPSNDTLLSIGWIEISNKHVKLNKANHILIYSQNSVAPSAKIHGLHDSHVAGASSLGKALSVFIRDAHKKVLVFHHAPLDLEFLQRAAMETVGCPLLFTYIDTMEIEQRRLALQNRKDSLQLNLCRQRYGLPTCTEHNALADARATAELFLAQSEYLAPNSPLLLKHLPLHCT